VLKNKQKVDVDWQHQLANAVREGALISGALIAVFLILSLASYYPGDPGWRTAGQFVTIQNLGGSFGALISDILFSLIGFMAYLVAAMPIVQLVKRIIGPVIKHSWLGMSWRFLGLTLLLVSGAALSAIYDGASELPLGVGGAVGSGLSIWLTELFGTVGGTMLLVGVFLFGLTVFGDISWLASLDHLGGLILKIGQSSKSFVQNRLANRKEKKTEKAKLKAQAAEAKKKEGVHLNIPTPTKNKALSNEGDIESEKAIPVLADIKSKLSPQSKKKESKNALTKVEDKPQEKKLKIQPFEKKSKVQMTSQGSLFETC